MISLRKLHLDNCDLRRVPVFVRELSSLEEISLFGNEHLQIDAPLDDLVECCPRLILVDMRKGRGGTWTPQSLAHLNAFKAKLQKKNPKAQVEFYEFRVFVFFFCFCSFLFRTVFGERERERERERVAGNLFLFCFVLCGRERGGSVSVNRERVLFSIHSKRSRSRSRRRRKKRSFSLSKSTHPPTHRGQTIKYP